MDIRMIYNKFLVADSLSDNEVVALRDHFLATSENLVHLGPRFRLASNESAETYDRLRDICIARRLNS